MGRQRSRGINPLAVQLGQLRLTMDADTVGLWQFNEGSGNSVYDVSPSAKTIALQGSPAWKTNDARYSRTLSFDGVDDAGSFSGAALYSLSAFTIEAIVRSSIYNMPSGEYPIYVEGTTTEVRLRCGRANNAFFFGWMNTARTAWYDFLSTYNPIWTDWNYLAATKDNLSQALYINGQSAGTNVAPGGPPQEDPTTTYFCRYPESGFWGAFEVASIRISKVARSSAEILRTARVLGFAQ